MSLIRSFLAIPLTDEVRTLCREEQRHLSSFLPGVQWIRAETMHLTLHFFGPVREEDLDRIGDIMLSVGNLCSPFNLRINGIGAFPNFRRPRVIWAGLEDTEPLLALYEQLQQGLASHGFNREERPFTPHLTLGRIRRPGGQRSGGLPDNHLFTGGCLPVDRIILYESSLRPEGLRLGLNESYRRFQDIMADKNRESAIDLAVGQIEKQFGKGSIMRLGEDVVLPGVQAISSGSISLDIALGVGGVPRGRIIEIYGPESSGKTTLTLHIIAEAQKKGGIAAFVDAEHALDISYARKLGVKTDDLLVSQPDTGEQALEIAEVLVRSGAIDVLVIDSVAALVPRAEIEGEMGDSHMGLQARLMSQALRKLTATISKSNCCVIFINQIRMKIGVMFGNPETTTGGNALKFYSSVRMDIRKIASIKQGQDVVGNRTRVKIVKNKIAPPFKEAEFDIMYGEGISREGDIVDLGVTCNIVDKSGAWFSYSGERIGQGRENAKQFLKEHPETCQSIEEKILQHFGLGEAKAGGDES